MKFYLFVFLGNKKRKGFSLIETLVAMAVGVIVFGFITDLMIKQQKEQKFIAQKLEQSDFKNNLLSIFSKRNNCTCQFLNNSTNPNQTNYSNLQFNSNNTSGSEVINANALYPGCVRNRNLVFPLSSL
jgi:prepilin-type N-terminal cleavage/methylation domain-containing protein